MATEYVGNVTYNYKFRDRDLNDSTTGINFSLPDTTAMTAVIDFGEAFGQALAQVSDATFMGMTTSVNTRENPVPVALAPESSDVERKGVLTFRTAGNTTASIKIPSILATLVIDRGQSLNLADPLMVTLVTLLVDGPLGGGNGASTAANVQYEAIYSSKKIHVGSSKG